MHTRRQFLRTSMLGAAASWTLPIFLEKAFFALDAMAANALTQTPTGKDETILVVLQMAGGNDGLNMLVPYADDSYYRSRPTLGLPGDKILKLNSYLGLNGKLTGLKALFDEGHLSVVQGVGYPNPNRSHFRSTEIWQTASDADRNESEGWLGRYFDNCCAGAYPTVGVAIGEEMPQAFAAKTSNWHYVFAAGTVPHPQGLLAESLSLIARMIAGDLPTRVYYASQGGFDTHARQIMAHERLMGELNDGLSAFATDLKQQRNFDRVLLITFSEFGRRVAENANGGTDHGAAASMFVLGGAAKPGCSGNIRA